MSSAPVASARPTRRTLLSLIAGFVAFIAGTTAMLPWQSRPPDEVAVVVALPVIWLFVSVVIIVYALDTVLAVAIQRYYKRGQVTLKGDIYHVQLELTLTAFWQGALNAFPFAALSLAALTVVGLCYASEIRWALPVIMQATVGLLIGTGGAFVFGWIRGILRRRGARGRVGRFMPAPWALRILHLLWSMGVARGARRFS